MKKVAYGLLSCMLVLVVAQAGAQTGPKTSGALVVVPAYGEVRQANDEVRTAFMIEEQDKDKAAAASRVNQKMKQGMEIIKREDPQAKLKTYGYYTYPVYPEDQPRPFNTKGRQPASWRVGQFLEVTTRNLEALPKTVAAAQRVLALNGLQFGLSEKTARKLDEQRIAAAYQNLNERVAAIAKAMGRSVSDTVLESVDFEAAGNYLPQAEAMKGARLANAAAEPAPVEEPSFEPGETALQMRVVGKVRFK